MIAENGAESTPAGDLNPAPARTANRTRHTPHASDSSSPGIRS